MTKHTAEEIWSAVYACAQPAFDRMRHNAGGAWPGWELRMMPPVPAEWPPDGSGRLVFYAGAARSGLPDLMDGEVTAHMWARVEVDAAAGTPIAVTLEQLTDSIVEDGIQGVRPMNEGEVAIAESAAQVLDALVEMTASVADPSTSPHAAAVCAYYIQATGFLGSLGRVVRQDHAGFAEWLGAASSR